MKIDLTALFSGYHEELKIESVRQRTNLEIKKVDISACAENTLSLASKDQAILTIKTICPGSCVLSEAEQTLKQLGASEEVIRKFIWNRTGGRPKPVEGAQWGQSV